jgi:IS5 family transposase
VDATIIGAPSSTKNQNKARDPQMHQIQMHQNKMHLIKNGNQWCFGMKAHISVYEATGLVPRVLTTAANVGDVTQNGDLLHGKEKTVYADAGYIGAEKHAPAKRGRKWHIAAKRSKVKAVDDEPLCDLTEQIEHLQVSIGAAAEHPFRVIKRQRGHVKARHRGRAKNGAQVLTPFALSNLWMTRKHLPGKGG